MADVYTDLLAGLVTGIQTAENRTVEQVVEALYTLSLVSDLTPTFLAEADSVFEELELETYPRYLRRLAKFIREGGVPGRGPTVADQLPITVYNSTPAVSGLVGATIAMGNGTTDVPTTVADALNIQNDGTTYPIIVRTATIGGTHASQFAVDTDLDPDVEIAPGANLNISITMTLTTTGARSATLTVATNCGTFVYPITATAVAP